MKKVIDVKLQWQEFYCSGTAEELIGKLKRLQKEAQERGAECFICKEIESGCYPGDSDRTVLNIYDRRLETDEEYQERLKKEEEDKEKVLQHKRKQLEFLKKELGE